MAIIVTTIEEAAIVSKIKMAIKLIAIIRLLMIQFYREYHLSQEIASTATIAVVPELSNDIQQVISV